MKIQKLDDSNNVIGIYDDIMAAAKSVESRKDTWQVALTIAQVIGTQKRAYKFKWKKIS